tara:strand:+ start:35 stop:454 length:420 start_codon:yes stop_codon:yes gene_type:complete
MSNFFLGIKRFNTRILLLALIINFVLYYLSTNGTLDITYEDFIERFKRINNKEDFVVYSSIAIVAILFLLNILISSFIVKSKDEVRNTERLVKIEKNIDNSMKKIDSKLGELQTDLDKIKERQLASEVKKTSTGEEFSK